MTVTPPSGCTSIDRVPDEKQTATVKKGPSKPETTYMQYIKHHLLVLLKYNSS